MSGGGNADLVDLTMSLHHVGERSVWVSDTGERDDAVNLPLSQIEIVNKGNGIVEITMPVWLATDRGLV